MRTEADICALLTRREVIKARRLDIGQVLFASVLWTDSKSISLKKKKLRSKFLAILDRPNFGQ